jgi:indole-3-glycerol phosphate synthase
MARDAGLSECRRPSIGADRSSLPRREAAMTGLLSAMAQSSLTRVREAQTREPQRALWSRANQTPAAPRLRLSSEGFDLITECKLHSPSAGDLSARTKDIEGRVVSYARGGAAAVSVVTEPSRFGGTLEHLREASRALTPLNVPTMRKDFLIDPYQVMEARAAGAGGVLVIVRMLERCHLAELIDCAAMLQMFVLLETFDAADLATAKEILGARKRHDEQILIGVNCRDLDTLKVDLGRLADLANELPIDCPHVAESGVTTLADIDRVVDLGYEVALVGTALMATAAPCELVGAMLTAGRERAMHHRAD